MRMLGRAGSQARKAAIEIANMMYSRSGEKGLGFLQLSTLQKNEFMNQLETILGEDLYSPENQLAFEQAVDDRIPTEATGTGIALTPKAKQIRLFLERMHDEYISKVPETRSASSKTISLFDLIYCRSVIILKHLLKYFLTIKTH